MWHVVLVRDGKANGVLLLVPEPFDVETQVYNANGSLRTGHAMR